VTCAYAIAILSGRIEARTRKVRTYLYCVLLLFLAACSGGVREVDRIATDCEPSPVYIVLGATDAGVSLVDSASVTDAAETSNVANVNADADAGSRFRPGGFFTYVKPGQNMLLDIPLGAIAVQVSGVSDVGVSPSVAVEQWTPDPPISLQEYDPNVLVGYQPFLEGATRILIGNLDATNTVDISVSWEFW
jgi:hypothetical protein